MSSWLLYVIIIIIAAPIVLSLLGCFGKGFWRGLREPVLNNMSEEEQWRIIREITGEGRLRVFRAEDDD